MGSHCGVCGYPRAMAHAPCGACGAEPDRTGYIDDPGAATEFKGPRLEDHPELEPAFAAWKRRDFPRLVSQCLQALQLPTPQVVRQPEGPAWALQVKSAPIFIVLDQAASEIGIESPLVRVTRADEAAMLREALELNASIHSITRICVRDALLVLRFADAIARTPPPKLVYALLSVARKSVPLGEALAIRFRTPRLGAESKNTVRVYGLDFALRGVPRTLDVLR